MQKQTKNQIKFHLPVSKMFLTSGALGDCSELQLWHHGSPVSVAGAVLHGPVPRLVVWVPSWGSPGRTELWPLLSYYATTFTLKILPSEFTPGKTASQKAGEKKMRKKMSNFLSSSTSTLDEERGVYWSRLQELRTREDDVYNFPSQGTLSSKH